jgi:hypothetical protein
MELVGAVTDTDIRWHSLEVHCYCCFFSPLSAAIFTGSPFRFELSWPVLCTTYITVSPTSEMTVAHAADHTLMLTPPLGHLGNAIAHSTYHGTHPLGYVNIGVFACQNCSPNLKPVVEIHRIADAFVSNPERVEETAAAVVTVSTLYLQLQQVLHTCLVVLRQRLVVVSPYLRPPRKVILRTYGCHLSLQTDHITP